ncbi:MAG: CRISPR-associated helicase Cas3' [Clostridia bacterium]
MMEYIAHKTDDGKEQPLAEHLDNVAKICRKNAVEDFKDYAELCGLLHDVGKYTAAFQRRINGSNERVEHACCGAQELNKLGKNFYVPMLEYCIAGHHSGLPDGGTRTDEPDKPTLKGILKRKAEDFSAYKTEISVGYPKDNMVKFFLKGKDDGQENIERYAFFTRYMYSCLTDADFIDTERFFSPDTERGIKGDFSRAYELVCEKMDGFKTETEIQRTRGRLQKQVYESAERKAHVYTVNMPTGSGKTLCSIRTALKKAVDENKKRIIYVIPYTSIIEQTADVFENIFGDVLPVLQHHSNFDFDSDDTDENIAASDKLKRTCENWDAPLIITTNVQFFESLYHYKSSRLRKLHNLADSVIVFDEIHMLPIEYIQPCLRAIGYITKYLNSTVMLMSATMPDYTEFIKKYMPDNNVVDAVEDKELFSVFEKCRYEYISECSLEAIAEKADSFQSALIIVNKRKTAKKLYNICKNICDGNKYHLSTYMTPQHRSRVIEKIKNDLSGGIKTIVVSTSLVEAGVDFDFETVFRENAGLDNVIQSGGRCNREGKRPVGNVYVFENDVGKGEIQQKANITRSLFNEFENIASAECVKEYYRRLLAVNKDRIENNSIAALMGGSYIFDAIPFREYSERFNFIDSQCIGIVIPDDNSSGLIEKLKYGGLSAKRGLQKYCASIYFYELEDMLKSGLAEQLGCGVYVLTNSDYYNDELGLDLETEMDYIL